MTQLELDWSLYPNFSAPEMKCRCGCRRADMDPLFMETLQSIRVVYGKPMPVTSGFRCEDHDRRIGGAGVHPTGRAADISVSGEDVYHLLHTAIGLKIRGIGLKQRGPHFLRFMHLDTLSEPMRPRIWTYP